MKPSVMLTLALLLAAGCDSGPRIVVLAELDGRPVADLPLTLLPYDRERLQDSLRREAGDDAPTLPQELLRDVARLDSVLARPAADSAAMQRADSLRRVRDSLSVRLDTARAKAARWEERLHARADSLGRTTAAAAERGAAADTTDGSGRAELAASPGSSWVRGRYILPDVVLEWNVGVTLPAGQDSILVRLDRGNARALRAPSPTVGP